MNALPLPQTFFFKLVSSQHNWAESTECSHLPLSLNMDRLPHYLYLASQSYSCYNWRIYTDILLSSKGHTLHHQDSTHHLGHSIGFDKCKATCICHYCIIQSSFTTPQILRAPNIHASLPILPGNDIKFYCLCILPFQYCPIVVIIRYV